MVGTTVGLQLRIFMLGICALGTTGCSSEDTPETSVGQVRQTLISDGAHNSGTAGLLFLPPIGSPGRPKESFEARLAPQVRIDRIDPRTGTSLQTIATFTAAARVRSDRVLRNPRQGFYIARWQTRRFALEPAIYRARIVVGGRELGFADVRVVRRAKDLDQVDRKQYLPLLDGRTLPIRFRIAKGTVDQDGDGVFDWDDNCPTTPNPPAKATLDPLPSTFPVPPGCDADEEDCDPNEVACNPETAKQLDTDGDGKGDACECDGVACALEGACRAAGVCVPTTGTCTSPPLPDGQSCDDGNACTRVDRCIFGVCTGESPVDCVSGDPCQEPAGCDSETGQCAFVAAINGTACDDANACTSGDACSGGVCVGAPVACQPVDECHEVGSCDPTTGVCSHPLKDGSCQAYSGLPVVALVHSAAVVGPAGAHIDVAPGFALDIPVGALDTPTTISAELAAPWPHVAALGEQLAPVIELRPHGLEFDERVRLTLPMPALGIDAIRVTAMQPDETEPVPLPIWSGATPGLLYAGLDHFCQIDVTAITGASPEMQRLLDKRTGPGTVYSYTRAQPNTGCTTDGVVGLSAQIFDEYNDVLGVFVNPPAKLIDSNGIGWLNVNVVEPTWPRLSKLARLQVPAMAHLIFADTDPRAPGWGFNVNSSWRSLAQQFVLWSCRGTSVVSEPGKSPHADGRAIDIGPQKLQEQVAICRQALSIPGSTVADALEVVHPGWGRILEDAGFRWYGTARSTTEELERICGPNRSWCPELSIEACKDPVHFEQPPTAAPESRDLKRKSVLAFQRLWNRQHPCAQVELTSNFDLATQAALEASPADGFTTPLLEEDLPREGVEVEECDSSAKRCCSDANGTGNYCSDDCSPACPPPYYHCSCSACRFSGPTEFCISESCGMIDGCSQPPVDCMHDDIHP